ncbi:hypothetical protein ACVWYK_004130 [Bradyrhizobium sp. USDA 4470]
MNGHQFGGLPQPQGREQAGDTEHVIEMTMREQNAIKPPKAGATPQQLALRTFAAIDQHAFARDLQEDCRMIALCRGNAGRGAEKCQGEHA